VLLAHFRIGRPEVISFMAALGGKGEG